MHGASQSPAIFVAWSAALKTMRFGSTPSSGISSNSFFAFQVQWALLGPPQILGFRGLRFRP